MDRATRLILDNTAVTRPYLCPEIRLRIVTEECPLWSAREEDLEAMGIPSPFWAFCWAGGEALARFVLDHPERVSGRRVLSFGAGCGVDAIAAAMAGGDVLASDIDPLAIRCVEINAELNDVSVRTSTDDWLGRNGHDPEVVLVGDVTYDKELAQRVVAWLTGLSERGVEVLLADPGRGCLPAEAMDRLVERAVLRAPADNDRGHRSMVSTTVYSLG